MGAGDCDVSGRLRVEKPDENDDDADDTAKRFSSTAAAASEDEKTMLGEGRRTSNRRELLPLAARWCRETVLPRCCCCCVTAARLLRLKLRPRERLGLFVREGDAGRVETVVRERLGLLPPILVRVRVVEVGGIELAAVLAATLFVRERAAVRFGEIETMVEAEEGAEVGEEKGMKVVDEVESESFLPPSVPVSLLVISWFEMGVVPAADTVEAAKKEELEGTEEENWCEVDVGKLEIVEIVETVVDMEDDGGEDEEEKDDEAEDKGDEGVVEGEDGEEGKFWSVSGNIIGEYVKKQEFG